MTEPTNKAARLRKTIMSPPSRPKFYVTGSGMIVLIQFHFALYSLAIRYVSIFDVVLGSVILLRRLLISIRRFIHSAKTCSRCQIRYLAKREQYAKGVYGSVTHPPRWLGRKYPLS